MTNDENKTNRDLLDKALEAPLGMTTGGITARPVEVVIGKKVAGRELSENGPFIAKNGPSAVGAYPHLYRVGDLIFVSGIGPRSPENNKIIGGPIKDKQGNSLEYDIRAQTRSVIENISIILEEYGSSLDQVVDVYSMLVDMDRDFDGYNEVYAEYFENIMPARTTCSVSALPTPIAVELKVIAKI
ncbi:MAG: RidA family protein [Candidatus Poseidoniales archaeon]|jgi:2-aminomuconate deaminase|tara:strand:+ start:303 stop:860 length:558 start_codon:yes stop_codon:yes gene_type:complete